MNKDFDYKKDLAGKLDELKKIEGFPIGTDEDILALSDPPYFTACPNPFIKDFIEEYGTSYDKENDNYNSIPYTDDIDTNKNDRLTNAHSYHTKSPFHAIQRYIEHYTKKGDLVLDCFTGSGMTGIAAQKSGRKSILMDLSPIATLLAHNYNSSVSSDKFLAAAGQIICEIEKESGWMTLTRHTDGKIGKIRSILFSENFICPLCNHSFVLWDYAVDIENGVFNDPFICKNCGGEINKSDCEKLTIKKFDKYLQQEIEQVKIDAVEIVYVLNKKRFTKSPDKEDLELISKINNSTIPYHFPTDRMKEGGETRRNDSNGLTHVHHYFTDRNLHFLSLSSD
jgi:transcription elongation factor Elf1